MALRNILPDSDPTLRKVSRPVTEFNERMHKLLDDMRETLINANGLGLAAPQVGILRRAILVVDLNDETEDGEEVIIELINPEIIAKSGEQDGSEGCLSLPGRYGMVKRPMVVKVRAQDRHGETFEVWGKGITARAFCHEIDHLNGVLFPDVASRMLTEEELEAMAEAEMEDDEEEVGEE